MSKSETKIIILKIYFIIKQVVDLLFWKDELLVV